MSWWSGVVPVMVLLHITNIKTGWFAERDQAAVPWTLQVYIDSWWWYQLEICLCDWRDNFYIKIEGLPASHSQSCPKVCNIFPSTLFWTSVEERLRSRVTQCRTLCTGPEWTCRRVCMISGGASEAERDYLMPMHSMCAFLSGWSWALSSYSKCSRCF